MKKVNFSLAPKIIEKRKKSSSVEQNQALSCKKKDNIHSAKISNSRNINNENYE